MKKTIFITLLLLLCGFMQAAKQADPNVYTVTATVNNATFGTITPADAGTTYNEGDDITYTLTPADNCELFYLSVNGEDKTSEVVDGKYTVTNISEDLVINAVFRPAGQKYFFTMSAVGGYPDNPPSAQNLPITRAMFDPETKSCIYSITNDDYRKYVSVRVAETVVALGNQPPEIDVAKWYVVGLNFCMVQPGITKPGNYKFTYYWNDDTNQYFINDEFQSLLPFTVNVDVSAAGWTDDIYIHVKGDPERVYQMQARKTPGWYSYTFENEADSLDIYFTNGENGTDTNQTEELTGISSSICYAVEADRTLAESECPPADPVEISTADDLVMKLITNTDPNALFRLTGDIDMGAWIDASSDDDVKTNGWKSLGTQNQPITGTLDGAGFFLYDIWSNRPTVSSSGGFIARAKALTIKNLGIKTKAGESLTGMDNMGAFVCDFDSVQIENCCFNGIVKGGKQVGAFFGQTQTGGSSIKNSYACGGVYGTDNVGGLWGRTNYSNSSVEESYAMVTVNGQNGQGSAAGIIASADMASAAATDIVVSVKNSFVFNDTISGAWAAAAICAYNRNIGNVEVVNSVQLNAQQQIIQGNTGRGSCVNATYTRTKQQAFEVDTVFANRAWDFDDVWQFGNANYPAPVLKNLTMAYQPAGVPKHLTGIFADFISISVDGSNGTIMPNEPFSVAGGTNVEFTITPEMNYEVSKLLVNGVDKTSDIQAGKYVVTNASKITYTLVVSFKPVENSILNPDINALAVFPNPTKGVFYIDCQGKPEEVSVFNILGKKVYTGTENKVDISNLPDGIYLVNLKIDKQVVTKRILKK